MPFTFPSIRREKEVLEAKKNNPSFFKFVETSYPRVREQRTFKALVRITIFIPVLIAFILLLFIWLSTQNEKVQWVLLFGVFLLGSVMAWLARYLLELLATALELSEMQTAQSEEQFRLLANSIPELVSVASGDGQPLWYNDAWYRYTGSSPVSSHKGHLGIYWKHVHHPEFFQVVYDRWKLALETGQAYEMQFPVKGRDGQYRRFLYRATPVKDKNQNVILWFGTSTDIEAEMIQMEDQKFLKDAATALNSTLDTRDILSVSCSYIIPKLVDWGIAISFENNDPQHISDLFLINKGESQEPSLGVRQNYAQLLTSFDLGILSNGEPQTVDLPDSNTLGFKTAVLYPIFNREKLMGVFLFAIGADRTWNERQVRLISEFARVASSAINKAQLHEEIKEAVLTRDDFISIASHELKTPLTSLQLQIQLLERQVQTHMTPTSDTLKTVVFCKTQIIRLSQLLNQLLDTTQIRMGNMPIEKVTCDLSLRVDEICNRFQSELENKGIQLNWNRKKPVIGAWDPLKIDQVITNLISNA
ncbi:MAG: PAS domain-containing sensor histidine kinase, partial [Proteobacteria bacterium]|nr:PAS domain-containing sensor histidine kinase [Pseudomonadota bacterium]